ncbi:MAG: isoleucine--tRNA ligase [Pseudobacteriovorax sp.]|nr:isoleucine--tRNA ligase [Pseudobacteriovorax sp.]
MKPINSHVNLPEVEESILKNWQAGEIFKKSNDKRQGAKEFNFYDGPPFANGLPHYGHLLANTIKDTVPRYWNMRGYNVDRRFGWDTHGVPVEFEVEKNENLNGRQDILEMGVDVFNEKCRKSVLHYTNEWQTTITRLGRWVDWDRQYRTMDKSFMESVWWVFRSLYDKGLVYQDYKVVPYSPRITAVLSNFEANQNYQDVQDPAITVKFKLKSEETYVLAWTTTPWTLISNLALGVSSEIEYVKVRHKESGDVFICANDLLKQVIKPSKKQKLEDLCEILEKVSGKDLVGKTYEPLFPYFKDEAHAFQILDADFVNTNNGTGIVHLAPAYGEDDFHACRKAGIGIVDPLDEDGCYTKQIPEYTGQFVKDADKNIIKDLKQSGALFKQDTIVHSYPMCERTNGPLIYRAIPSWYVAVEKFKDQMVENNKTINWVPGHLKSGRMGKWLENARDWAISRNRFWGTPIPIWVCDCDETKVDCIGSVSELEEKTGKKIEDLHKHFIDDLEYPCSTCNGTMKRISEVFDCWFESGSMPYAQMHYPFENKDRFETNFPADFIAEGLDQTRGWFYTLAVLSAALTGKPAFKNVIVNGLVLANDGRKMSKRWKNFTPPVDLINEYGADSVRLYMLNSAILRGEDLKFSNEGVKETTRSVILPLWNSLSFLTTYADLDKWKPHADLVDQAPKATTEIDSWLLSKFQSLVGSIHEDMERYELYSVVPKLIAFINDLTNWYIRLSRRKFWGGQGEMSLETKSAYESLFHVLINFSKVFAPFAPFVSEKIYQVLVENLDGVEESVHLCDIPLANKELVNNKLEHKMSKAMVVAELGRSLRAKHQIKTRQVLPSVLVIVSNQEDMEAVSDAEELIKTELNIKEVDYSMDEIKYVNLSIKPNLRTLGKKLGKKLNTVKASLLEMSLDQTKVAKLLSEVESGGEVVIDGEALTETDFLIDRGPKDSRLIATSAGITLLLDTNLTPELIREGLAREIVNRVQNMRKENNLQISDKILLEHSSSDELAKAIEEHAQYIEKETQAIRIKSLSKDQSSQLSISESFAFGDHETKIAIQVES